MGNNNIKSLTSRKAVSRLTPHLRTGARVLSPSSGVRPGARALNLELPTSFGSAGLGFHSGSAPKIFHFSKPLALAKPVLVILAVAFLALLSLGNSAYAASYLNVSSGGAVSFGSIRPTSSGTSSTGSDTLTVHTDCSAGYSVYVSGQNGKDTNLTNSSAESNNTISTSSNAIGSAGSLSSNTWGLNSENTGVYVGLPTYANATNKALTTKTSVSETSAVPIYYGIKVDTSITPGTYTGDVLYTVLMDSSCLTYTVQFDANGGAGTMGNQTIVTNTATALSANSFTRTNYNFLGWSTSAKGKTGTATDGIGTADDVEYDDKQSVANLTTSGSTIKLYAIWELVGHQLSVVNGNAVAISSVTLENATTGEAITSGSYIPEGTSITATCANISYYHCTTFASSNTDLLASYDQPSATAVTLTYNFAMPAEDITLTANGDPNAYTLYYSLGAYGDASTSVTVTYGTDILIASNDFSSPNTNWNFQSWNRSITGTSTSYSPGDSVPSQMLKSNIDKQNGGTAYLYAIWAAPDDGNKGNFQTESSCSSIGANHVATLTDTRDNQEYSVYRFADSGTVGTDYPRNMSGYCIMTQDLALGYVTGGSTTKGADLNLTTATSTFDTNGTSSVLSKNETIALSGTQTVYYRSESNWDKTDSYTNMQYVNGPFNKSSYSAPYTHHSYYSYGAALVVCPKGWRLPTKLEYGYIIAFLGGKNTGFYKLQAPPYSFDSIGNYSSSGLWTAEREYWTSTQRDYSTEYAPFLSVTGTVNTDTSTFKNHGLAVRCVAASSPYTYTLSYSGVGFATANKPETQTYTGSEASHTFTIPGAKPTYSITGTQLTFLNYSYAGVTYNAGDTITLGNTSLAIALEANWTTSCTISSTTSCKLADGKTWILGYGGNTIAWDDMFTDSTGVKGHDATLNAAYEGVAICPSGYQAPTITDYDNLVKAYGGTSYMQRGYKETNAVLYRLVGDHNYWSSTELTSTYAYTLTRYANRLQMDSSSYGGHTDQLYALCYK